MKTSKSLALWRNALALVLTAAAVAFIAKAPALEAQGRPDLEARHQRLLPLFETNGVVFTDADETSGRLVVGVLDRRSEGQVRGRLRALGVDSQSVDVVETEPIVALAGLRDRSEDIVGGLQIRFSQYLCSLGFPAFRNGVLGFVTASHCSDNQGAVDGTTYYQPLDQVPGDVIGTEIADPPYGRGGGPKCPKGRRCRQSDANFSRSAGGTRAVTIGKIARTLGLGSLDIDSAHPTFTINAEAQGEAKVNDPANKVGRTTGWTRGLVSNTCVNTGVSGSTIVLLCQTFVTASGVIVQGGDSGSPVFGDPDSSGNVTLLGGLWGGNQSGTQFVYSPIANIEAELGALATN